MTDKSKTYSLFIHNGCLSLEAIKRYQKATLTPKELTEVEKHLSSCDLCKDAVEGMSLISDENKLNAILAEINDYVRKQLDVDKRTPKIISISNRFFYSGAAASIVILLGLLLYFQYYTNDKYSGELIVVTQQIHEIPIPVEQKELIDHEALEVAEDLAKEPEKTNKAKARGKDASPGQSKGTYYKAPLDAMKKKDSGALAAYQDQDELSTTQVRKAIDITSTLPAEYYLESITVTDNADSHNESLFALNGSKTSHQSGKSGKGARMEKASSNHFFQTVDKMAEFPGGKEAMSQFLYSNLSYPQEAKKSGLQGIVLVSFIVEKNGNLSNITVLHGIGGGCEEEAIRVIRLMPQWTPAITEGKEERVLFKLPIRFKLY
jgi:TonB family protein